MSSDLRVGILKERNPLPNLEKILTVVIVASTIVCERGVPLTHNPGDSPATHPLPRGRYPSPLCPHHPSPVSHVIADVTERGECPTREISPLRLSGVSPKFLL